MASANLLRGDGFPREKRFVDAHLDGAHETDVGRHLGARGQKDDVARHELFAADLLLPAVPDNARLGDDHLLEGPHALLGPALLDEPDDRVEGQNGGDDDRVLVFVQGEGHDRGDEEDVDQGACKLAQEDDERADPLFLGQAVGPVRRESLGRSLFGQTLRGGAESLERLFSGFAIPFGWIP